MLRKALGWAAVVVVAMWIYHKPDQVAAVIHHVVQVLGKLAGSL